MSGLFDSVGEANNNPEKNWQKPGVSFAKITNINDPKKLGRVKCKYCTADDDAGETGWIYCTTMFGGKENGLFFHPNVGDMVVLAYENGDSLRPIVIGSLWVGDSKAPVEVSSGKNETYQVVTPNKSKIDFSDEKGKEKITIETPKKRTVVLDDENQLIKVADDKNSLEINGKNGTTTLTCEQKLIIKVGKSLTITCDGSTGDLKIQPKKSVAIDTAQYKVKASGTLELTANGAATLKSSGVTTIKGSATKIN